MPKQRKPVPAFTVVLADWKDTNELLAGLKRALKARGVILQSWDLGSDDVVVSVSTRRVALREIKAEFAHDADDPMVDGITENRI